jgi:hypothetical protein
MFADTISVQRSSQEATGDQLWVRGFFQSPLIVIGGPSIETKLAVLFKAPLRSKRNQPPSTKVLGYKQQKVTMW